jgi:hypothetical protein
MILSKDSYFLINLPLQLSNIALVSFILNSHLKIFNSCFKMVFLNPKLFFLFRNWYNMLSEKPAVFEKAVLEVKQLGFKPEKTF